MERVVANSQTPPPPPSPPPTTPSPKPAPTPPPRTTTITTTTMAPATALTKLCWMSYGDGGSCLEGAHATLFSCVDKATRAQLAWASVSMVVFRHQQLAGGRPAATAHWLSLPHRGHILASGIVFVISGSYSGLPGVILPDCRRGGY